MTEVNSLQHILQDQLQIPGALLTKYTKLGLDEREVLLILQLIRFFQEDNEFPTPLELAEHLTISEKQSSNILMKLIQKGFLKIEQKENDLAQISEAYSINPLLEKLYTKEEPEEENIIGTIFILFEQEFGRPLSPFEIEMINAWLDEDKFVPALIKAGLRESVLMGKLNFKYIDRILREWKKKGIHSVEQARNASKNFHNRQKVNTAPPAEKRDTSIYYNWLEGED
ncbi:DnaD domain-containing protein [Oceanobacillus sp. FSL H7-0719]|uniref:DnaD domain-containing protein n=1 Tax=Oceanobacillus sp. FSL H7-0719 TaxID=2954507 RepID=UPI00324D4F0E